ncbi:MAG: glycosyltransferase family 4 protein [Anaerolineae bacterium]|nr:glycosyltransferase family 4 protein [Anaerolineae bacterium]
MRILHVVHGYPPSIGGSQLLVQRLSEQLVVHYRDQVTVFTTTARNIEMFWNPRETALPAGTEVINGVIVRRFPVFSRLNTLRRIAAAVGYRLRLPYNDWLRTIQQGPLVPGMMQAIASSGADVVFATAFPLMHMYYAVAGARRGGIPLVLLGAIHTEDPWGYERKMIVRAIRQADAYIALTSFERDYLVARGIREEKITVIGGGVDARPFLQADGRAVRARYGWGDRPVIAFVGKQTARKRIDVLIEAMQRVWNEHPEACLLLAGASTVYSLQIRERIDRLPPHQRAQMSILADFQEEEKPELLAACDIFVLPSAEESLGIAFLEAWAAGKPVIGVQAGAIPSVIDEGRDGLLVPYGDPRSMARAILSLLNDPPGRFSMGQAGRKKVLENYTWEIFADRVRGVYETVISQRRRQ